MSSARDTQSDMPVLSPATHPGSGGSLGTLGRPWFRRLSSLWLGGGGLIAGLFCIFLAIAGFTVAAVILMIAVPLGMGVGARLLLVRRQKAPALSSVLGQVHDALGDLVVTRDMDRRILSANRTFKQLIGLARPEGMMLEDIGVHLRPSGLPHRYDLELATAEGQRIFVWQDVVTRNRGGGLVLHSIARDVTTERAEAEMAQEERLRAERSSAAKSRLLATVSHEIRTPLSGILGMSYLLGQNKLSPEQRNYLSGIDEAGQALNQLVEDLLDYSTIEVGRFELRPQSAQLRPLLENVVEMLSHRAHEKNIEIGASVEAGVPERLDFDAPRLRQVLFNVIGNAVKFTEKGGVSVNARLDEGDLVICVTDSGPGMTREEQQRVFGEYEQGGTVLQKSAGAGLGLSISVQIIREFGGSLTVSSKKGKGSTFTIRFEPTMPADAKPPAGRDKILRGSNVVLLAPAGPARAAIADTIRTLGGICYPVDDGTTARLRLVTLAASSMPATDLIVDHRAIDQFNSHLADDAEIAGLGLRKVLLVNPESRARQALDLFDAWLIRPLREQSLIDVLRGRIRGVEKRDALNDNAPGFSVTLSPHLPSDGLNILFGEDDPINAALVRAVLEKGGHKVHHVEEFESLLDSAMCGTAMRPDIIITDLSMPGGDGIEMLARLRAHERRLDLVPHPVIVLTAGRDDESRRQALLNGANRVMIKPVDPIRLLTEVHAVAALSARRAEAK